MTQKIILRKTLDDVQDDMSELYEDLKSGKVERENAAELANIAGKFLKAEQLKLANAMFLEHLRRGSVQPPLENRQPSIVQPRRRAA